MINSQEYKRIIENYSQKSNKGQVQCNKLKNKFHLQLHVMQIRNTHTSLEGRIKRYNLKKKKKKVHYK